MPRTTAGFRNPAATRLTELAQQRPEWRTWIVLLETAWRAIEDDRRTLSLSLVESSSSAEHAPLLHGGTLVVDAVQIGRLLRKLAAVAETEGGPALASYQPSAAEALELITAAIRQDSNALESLAAAHKIPPGAFGSVAHLAAVSVLQQCAGQIERQLPQHWREGYCPLCGAWPILAERRGLDRSRRLRCGRCAADWEVPWLYCIYCGERDHNRLGSLATDDRGEQDKVETCATCRGYLKSLPSLQGLSPLELLLHDLETIELDLVALDREYRRPSASGFALDLHVIGHASRPRL
jgi:FdhE protein